MGWQADRDFSAGEAPGEGAGLPGLPDGFGHGGPWAAIAPSAALAAALEAAAGPEDLYPGADVDALVGIARQWAAVESWAAAGLLAALRAMTREDSTGRPLLRRRADLPEGWDDSLTYEIAGALAMGPVSAGNLAGLAWTLGVRLPGIGRLLAAGVLTRAKAKLIAQVFEPLEDGEAARAEALLLPELAGQTYPQVERLAWRAALAVAPDAAGRRRKAAERERARVTVFREESGAVGLSGRDLPAAQALSGHANVVARAKEYAASGAFGDQTTSRLEALAYLHLLNGVSAADAIAFARTEVTEPPTDPDDNPEPDEDKDRDREDRERGTKEPRGGASTTADDSNGDGGNGSGDPGPDGHGPDGDRPDGGGPYGGGGNGGGEPGSGNRGPARPEVPVLPEVIVPLATLLGRAERPGENRLLGPLDPALARELAAAAARSPFSRWEVTVVDEHGYAVGHGVAHSVRGRRQVPQPPGRRSPGPEPPMPPASRQRPGEAPCALPALVNITVTEVFLHEIASRPGAPPGGCAPPGGREPGDWTLVPRSARGTPPTEEGSYGTWVLTLPGGRELTVAFDVVPTHSCDHRYETPGYHPSARLRRLVQVRDRECTFPTCSRAAQASDFEHAVPYDQGGRTDACNAGTRSRRCHQVKQMPGWSVTQQTKPGWHEWTTPTGRTYIQGPWRYIA